MSFVSAISRSSVIASSERPVRNLQDLDSQTGRWSIDLLVSVGIRLCGQALVTQFFLVEQECYRQKYPQMDQGTISRHDSFLSAVVSE
jgi:hypothetical protein